MRTALLMLALVGCGNPELEQDNKTMSQELSRAKGELAATKAKNKKLEAELGALRATVKDMKMAMVAADLGIEPGAKLGARFQTSLGDIECVLMPEVAPKTVVNFVKLAEGTKPWTDPTSGEKMDKPLYSGTIFHRVIPNFMIQGGDPMGSGRGGPGYRFEDETTPDVTFDKPGLLAMANAGPNTNGSQFFITDRSTPTHLNGKHTIFGTCQNLDVVQSIADAPRGRGDRPNQDVVLKRVEIVR